MKNAFTLIELVFVILLIGIMVAVGSSAFKPKYLQDDTNFIVAKIKEAQFLGIGYEHLKFGGDSVGPDYKTGCIYFKDTNLSEGASSSNQITYKIHIELDEDSDLYEQTICFDSKGRPHEDDFNGTILEEQKVLKLTYSNQSTEIVIEPITGYVIIK
ncbi:MAG: type II secretion system protein [Campylobacterota bacterium]|nr:type II secretion system protein [Campylobacterota bacterium]